MIKLKRLLKEESEPINSDEWDNWYEYVNYFDSDIPKEELVKLIKKYSLKGKSYFNGGVVKLHDNSTTVYLQNDKDNETYDLIHDIEDWINNISEYNCNKLKINPDDIHNDCVGGSLNELRKSPGEVFHYTREERWSLIKESGYMKGSYGTGINNRSTFGIFASANQEDHQDGSYGNVCLSLNLSAFLKESGKSEINIEFEPEAYDVMIRNYIRSSLDITSEEETSSDISGCTVIVNETIPIRYIKRLD